MYFYWFIDLDILGSSLLRNKIIFWIAYTYNQVFPIILFVFPNYEQGQTK